VTSVFAANALFAYGLELAPGFRARGPRGSVSALALAVGDSLAAGLLWCITVLLLAPLGIKRLDLLLLVPIVVPPLKALARTAAASSSGPLAAVGAESDELIVSSLVFGVALVCARGRFSLPEAFVAGGSSGLGYWLASSLLEALRERLELSGLPASLKGAPSMLISAGLMSMAFMGVDAVLVRNLVGAP